MQLFNARFPIAIIFTKKSAREREKDECLATLRLEQMVKFNLIPYRSSYILVNHRVIADDWKRSQLSVQLILSTKLDFLLLRRMLYVTVSHVI